MGLVGLTMICSSTVFTYKRHVASRLSLINVASLNRVLRSEIFVSEDGQLRAIHLVFDFKPLSNAFQDVGKAIRASDPRIHWIDVSHPGFLAREDLLPIDYPLPLALATTAVPRERTASSRLSLEPEID